MKEETPEQKSVSGRIAKEARRRAWEVHEERLHTLIEHQKRQFEAGTEQSKMQIYGVGNEEVEIIAAGIMAGIMNERAELIDAIGAIGQSIADGDYPKDDFMKNVADNTLGMAEDIILEILQAMLDRVRARGPHRQPIKWGDLPASPWEWERDLKERISKRSAPEAKAPAPPPPPSPPEPPVTGPDPDINF